MIQRFSFSLLIALSFFFFSSFAPKVQAGACFEDPIYERDWNAEVTTGARLRDVACMEGSAVLATVPVGEIVHVIAETDGWYQVERADGMKGWVGTWLIAETDKDFTVGEIPSNDGDFSDTRNHRYKKAIEYVAQHGIVQGYGDGKFGPDNPVRRSEFLKILLNTKFEEGLPGAQSRCFEDIEISDWWTPYICYAKEQGIISGYPDGTFKPQTFVSVKEAAKMIVNVLIDQQTISDQEHWYEIFLQVLNNQKAIPPTIHSIHEELTRGEMAEMVWRIDASISDQESASLESLLPSENDASLSSDIPGINMQEVFDTWLSFHNDVRENMSLPLYTYDERLHVTAHDWSAVAAERGYIDHKRDDQTVYYDYPRMVQWFADRGVSFKNSGGWTFSESIAYYPYSCSSNCTSKVKEILQSTFDWYMDEQDKASRPHYNSIVSSGFRVIGFGLEVGAGKLFLTTHYGTEVN